MEDIIINVFLLSLLCGVIFLIAALITYFFPPKKINYVYGYRTASSMRSQEAWDFGQRFSSIRMIKISVILIAIAPLGYFIPLDADFKFVVDIIIVIVMTAYLFISTERAIKKSFPEKTRE